MSKKDPFGDFGKKLKTSTDTQRSRTVVKTIVQKPKGRPKTFSEPTSRLVSDIRSSTFLSMQKALPGSRFKSQAHFVDEAIQHFLQSLP